jgi:hypothetical protein
VTCATAQKDSISKISEGSFDDYKDGGQQVI